LIFGPLGALAGTIIGLALGTIAGFVVLWLRQENNPSTTLGMNSALKVSLPSSVAEDPIQQLSEFQ
jgi:hypothetical protein